MLSKDFKEFIRLLNENDVKYLVTACQGRHSLWSSFIN